MARRENKVTFKEAGVEYSGKLPHFRNDHKIRFHDAAYPAPAGYRKAAKKRGAAALN